MGGLCPKKVVFIYPGIAYIGYGSYEPRLGTGDTDSVYAFSILASIIANRGYSFELIDLRQLDSEEALVKRLKQSDASFVAITVQTPSFDIATRVAAIAKSMGKITIGGGIHATVAPEDFESNPSWDYAVTGEGELAFPQLLDELVIGGKPEKIVQGDVLNDLDSLPLPHLFPEWGKTYVDSYATEVARGCPGRCTYCVSGERKFYRKMRFRSTEHILREIDHVHELYDFKTLLFLDVCASMNRSFFSRLLAELSRKYSELNLVISERVDTFNEEVANQLSRFKSCTVWFGFESASARILEFLRKNTTMEQAQRAVELCHFYKLDIGANVLIGVPTETEQDIKQTYNFIRRIKPKTLFCHILSPFPGTQIHRYCKESGLLPRVDTLERYELRQVLEKGLIKGIDYERIRYWHQRFHGLIRQDESRLPSLDRVLRFLWPARRRGH